MSKLKDRLHMEASEIIAIATAIATVITAIGGVIIAIRTAEVKKTVEHTKDLVNSRYTDLVSYQERLVATLQNAGIKIPGDVSLNRDSTTQ